MLGGTDLGTGILLKSETLLCSSNSLPESCASGVVALRGLKLHESRSMSAKGNDSGYLSGAINSNSTFASKQVATRIRSFCSQSRAPVAATELQSSSKESCTWANSCANFNHHVVKDKYKIMGKVGGGFHVRKAIHIATGNKVLVSFAKKNEDQPSTAEINFFLNQRSRILPAHFEVLHSNDKMYVMFQSVSKYSHLKTFASEHGLQFAEVKTMFLAICSLVEEFHSQTGEYLHNLSSRNIFVRKTSQGKTRFLFCPFYTSRAQDWYEDRVCQKETNFDELGEVLKDLHSLLWRNAGTRIVEEDEEEDLCAQLNNISMLFDQQAVSSFEQIKHFFNSGDEFNIMIHSIAEATVTPKVREVMQKALLENSNSLQTAEYDYLTHPVLSSNFRHLLFVMEAEKPKEIDWDKFTKQMNEEFYCLEKSKATSSQGSSLCDERLKNSILLYDTDSVRCDQIHSYRTCSLEKLARARSQDTRSSLENIVCVEKAAEEMPKDKRMPKRSNTFSGTSRKKICLSLKRTVTSRGFSNLFGLLKLTKVRKTTRQLYHMTCEISANTVKEKLSNYLTLNCDVFVEYDWIWDYLCVVKLEDGTVGSLEIMQNGTFVGISEKFVKGSRMMFKLETTRLIEASLC